MPPLQRRPVMGNLVADELLYADTATVQSLTASASLQTVLAENLSRKGGTLYNDTDKNCYVKFGDTASTTSFTAIVAKKDVDGVGGFLGLGAERVYTGVITCIWDAAPTGALRITELS